MQDQRGPRNFASLSDNSRSLRTAASRKVSTEEAEARQLERWRLEKVERKAEQARKAKEKSETEMEVLLGTVPYNNFNISDNNESLVDNISESEHEDNVDNDSDSDWEDINEEKDKIEYNTLKLKNFSRECDRYKTSNREGAKLANALLRDLGLVTKNNFSKLICPG